MSKKLSDYKKEGFHGIDAAMNKSDWNAIESILINTLQYLKRKNSEHFISEFTKQQILQYLTNEIDDLVDKNISRQIKKILNI